MATSKSVNLLPDIKQQRLKAQRRKRTLVLVALIIMAVGVGLPLLTGFTIGTQQVFLSNARNNNKNGIAELKSIEGLNEALTAQNQLDAIYNLRDTGQDYVGFIDFIEKAIPQGTQISSIAVSSEGALEISGSTDDVDSVNVLVQSLSSYTPSGLNLDKFDAERQTFIDNINVRGITPSEDEVTFSLEAVFNFSYLEAQDLPVDAQGDTESTNPFSEGDN